MEILELLWDHLPGILQGVTTGLLGWIWWTMKRTFVTRQDFEGYIRLTEERLNRGTLRMQHTEDKLDLMRAELMGELKVQREILARLENQFQIILRGHLELRDE
jgi:hypothetical protein